MCRSRWSEPDDVLRSAGRQALVPRQQLLVYRPRHEGQDTRPIHNRPPQTRKLQMSYAGPGAGAAAWLKAYADAGASHLVLRFAVDHERHLETVARLRRDLGW